MLENEIIEAIKSLPENDRDLDTITIVLNPNYQRYTMKTERTIFQNDIKDELNYMIEKKMIKKIKRRIKVFKDGILIDKSFAFYNLILE